MAPRIAVLSLACALALAACGDSDDGGGEGGSSRGAEAAIERTIVAFAKTDDPADCRELATRRLHEQIGKSGYETALTVCEEAAIDPLVEDAEKVTVSEIEVDGDSATAVASFVGSAFDGQTAKFALVEREGRWKHHELLGFVDFDAEKMATEWGREMLLPAKSPLEVEAATCLMDSLRKMDPEALEALMLDDDPTPLIEMGQACASRSDAL
ncbi:MAG TPA: hypothetical protein VHH14_03940 [Solirubrobacterales bacterium]|nr:hypothetical protein [Solirubrobacterales bacterium]